MIEKAMEYIRENLTSELSLEVVSEKMSFSPIHFHNMFKSATGMTLRKYVEEQRISKAANLLVTTDFTLTEIAYECGFSSQSYFSYAFKYGNVLSRFPEVAKDPQTIYWHQDM